MLFVVTLGRDLRDNLTPPLKVIGLGSYMTAIAPNMAAERADFP